MTMLNRRDYRYIWIIFGIVFVWIAILFFLVNIYGSNILEKMNDELNTEQQQIEEINNYVAVHGDLKSYQDKLKLNLQSLQEKVPESRNGEMADDSFLAQLNQMVAISRVQIIKLVPQKSDNAKREKRDETVARGSETCLEETISISVQGDYFAVLGFLRQLHVSSRLVAVKQGKIYQLSDINQSIVCDLTLQIYSYPYN